MYVYLGDCYNLNKHFIFKSLKEEAIKEEVEEQPCINCFHHQTQMLSETFLFTQVLQTGSSGPDVMFQHSHSKCSYVVFRRRKGVT